MAVTASTAAAKDKFSIAKSFAAITIKENKVLSVVCEDFQLFRVGVGFEVVSAPASR